MSAKPGNVREFDSSQGSVKGKILSEETVYCKLKQKINIGELHQCLIAW